MVGVFAASKDTTHSLTLGAAPTTTSASDASATHAPGGQPVALQASAASVNRIPVANAPLGGAALRHPARSRRLRSRLSW